MNSNSSKTAENDTLSLREQTSRGNGFVNLFLEVVLGVFLMKTNVACVLVLPINRGEHRRKHLF